MNHLAVLAVLAALLCSGFEYTTYAEPQEPVAPQQVQQPVQYYFKTERYLDGEIVSNEVIVQFKRRPNADELQQILTPLNAFVRKWYENPYFAAIRSRTVGTHRMGHWLRQHPLVERAIPYFFRRGRANRGDWMEYERLPDGREAMANEVLITFVPGFSHGDREKLLLELDAVALTNRFDGLFWKLRSRKYTTAQLLQILQSRPYVHEATPNLVSRVIHSHFDSKIQGSPNDPNYVNNNQWNLARVRAELAWTQGATGNTNVVIAILDSGIRSTHEDLVDNIWRAQRPFTLKLNSDTYEVPAQAIGFDAINTPNSQGQVDVDPEPSHQTANPAPPAEQGTGDHGTVVTGIAAARGNNTRGVAGLNWTAQIMTIKIHRRNAQGFLETTTDAQLDGIEFVIQAKRALGQQANVRVINCSWEAIYDVRLERAIKKANASDILVVASAGNGGSDRIGDNNDVVPFYPANFQKQDRTELPHLTAVLATDQNDERPQFSNFGQRMVHLSTTCASGPQAT